MRDILIIGSGNSKVLQLSPLREGGEKRIVTLDIDPFCKPDVLHDLNFVGLPFDENSFDEIHAYEVLEHLGRQGDWGHFFREFSDYHRVLRPDGYLMGSCPSARSRWLWGDPGHTRAIQPETLLFLDQEVYAQRVGKSSMTDYRSVYKADFKVVHSDDSDHRGSFFFGLQAIKPSRWKET